MPTIPLTRGHVTVVDDADYRSLARRKWRAKVTKGQVHAIRSVRDDDGRWVDEFMHRVVAGARPDQQVVHLDGDTLNNHFSDLRLASEGEKQAYAPPPA